MIRIAVSNRQRALAIDAPRLKRHARRILLEMGFVKAELSIACVDDGEMRLLNARYRSSHETTDVLAFAMNEGPFAGLNPHVLGDVVISVETAAFQAERARRDVGEELETLLIHGILHVLGYDHDRSPSDARIMSEKERRLRQLLRGA